MQRDIITELFVVENPTWVKENTSENSLKSRNNSSGNKWSSEPPSKKQRYDNGPVFNQNKEPRFKIPDDTIKFGEVYTPKTRKQFDRVIKMKMVISFAINIILKDFVIQIAN